MKNKLNMKETINTLIKKLRESNIAKQFAGLMVFIVLTIGTLYGLVECFDRLGWDVLGGISKPITVFFLIVSVVALVWIIIKMALADKKSETIDADVAAKKQDDSIIELLKDTVKLNHFREVIQIGAALRQSTCLKNRNDLRIKIGEYVCIAARECGDVNSEAIALIEDIGNTYLDHGDVENAISRIRSGIELVEGHIRELEGCEPIDETKINDARFIAVRGHRNMANCYSKKNDVYNANSHINSADSHINQLTNEEIKLEVLADLEYSKSKVCRAVSDWNNAIKHLTKSIEHYDELCRSYDSEENKEKRTDSTIKNLRELADLCHIVGKHRDADYYLKLGTERALNNLDYDNYVRMRVIQANAALQYYSDSFKAQFAMEQAGKYIQWVDSKSTIVLYNNALEMMGKQDEQKSNHQGSEED